MKHSSYCMFILAVIFVTSCNNQASDMKEAASAKDSKSTTNVTTSGDPLPSWNDGDTKKGIIDYVTAATKEGGSGFVPVNDRIAVFDNDGTLWSEQPLYFQLFYAFDKIREMAPQHPEWKTKEPYNSVLAGDIKKVLSSGEKGLLAMMNTTFGGMSGDAFDKSVKASSSPGSLETAPHCSSTKRTTASRTTRVSALSFVVTDSDSSSRLSLDWPRSSSGKGPCHLYRK